MITESRCMKYGLIIQRVVSIALVYLLLIMGLQTSQAKATEFDGVNYEHGVNDDLYYQEPYIDPACFDDPPGPGCYVKVIWYVKGTNCFELHQNMCAFLNVCDREMDPNTDPYECYLFENYVHPNFLKRLANDRSQGFVPFGWLTCMDNPSNSAPYCYRGAGSGINTDPVSTNPNGYKAGTYIHVNEPEKLSGVFREIADEITMKLTE